MWFLDCSCLWMPWKCFAGLMQGGSRSTILATIKYFYSYCQPVCATCLGIKLAGYLHCWIHRLQSVYSLLQTTCSLLHKTGMFMLLYIGTINVWTINKLYQNKRPRCCTLCTMHFGQCQASSAELGWWEMVLLPHAQNAAARWLTLFILQIEASQT